MWCLPLLLLCFATHIRPGYLIGRDRIRRDASELLILEGAYNDTHDATFSDATWQIGYNLQMCMGEQKMFFRQAKPDFTSLESIQSMLDVGNSVSGLLGLHWLSGLITVASKGIKKFQNDTTLDDVMKELKQGFSDINKKLNAIEDSIHGWGKFILDALQFNNYLVERKKIRTLGDRYAVWTSSLTDEYAYNEFVSGCVSNDMNDWFSGFKAMMDKRFSDGTDFAGGLAGVAERSRGHFARLARQIKMDICEATFLLGACESVRNASDHAKKEHSENAVLVYKELAKGFTAVDKELVNNARNDISAATNHFVEKKMIAGGDLSEQLRVELKQKYYWLDFSVTMLEMYAEITVTECAHMDDKCPCVISTDAIPALGTRYKAIVFIAGLSPKYGSNEPLWLPVRRIVAGLNSAHAQLEACTIWNDLMDVFNGVAVTSYIATVNRDKGFGREDGYNPIGPAATPGRMQEVQIHSWTAVSPHFGDLFTKRKHYAIVAITCSDDIYNY